jgi:prophage regulatory protein
MRDQKSYPIPIAEREGLVRLEEFLGYGRAIPMSRSAWLQGVRIGIFPKPLKLGRRLRVWRAADIKALIEVGTP